VDARSSLPRRATRPGTALVRSAGLSDGNDNIGSISCVAPWLQKAADSYELLDPESLPVSKWRLAMGVIQAIHGSAPLESQPDISIRVRNRITGEITEIATTRNQVSLHSWIQQLSQDLETLNVSEFALKYGLGSPR
jgi:hypothetical protein